MYIHTHTYRTLAGWDGASAGGCRGLFTFSASLYCGMSDLVTCASFVVSQGMGTYR